MFFNQVKTAILLVALSGLLGLFGLLVNGYNGLFVALFISLIFNFVAYYFSEKIVLRTYGAKKLDEVKYARVYDMVSSLCSSVNFPMPKLWLVEIPVANAFATGRNPKHSSIAVSPVLLEILDEGELRGVLAHELSHIRNRDILINSVAGVIASAISIMADLVRNAALYGSLTSRDDKKSNPFGIIIVTILMSFASTLIMLSISRSREYLADESGAEISHDPLALASALEKIQHSSLNVHNYDLGHGFVDTTYSHMFICNPISGVAGWIKTLFSTHPPMKKRIEKLHKIYEKMAGI